MDDVSIGPDTIYPDPDAILPIESPETKEKLNGRHRNGFGRSATTKFNELQEIKIDDEPKKLHSDMELTATTTSANNKHNLIDDSDGFKGKSIDFNVMQQHTLHTVEELNNEDLRDHDIIDNIMYIYYGSNVALRKSLGGSIIIVGTVFALAAQILAIIFTLLRNR